MASKQNAITVLLVIASAVLPYLLSQNDVVIPPVLKVVLTAANIAVVALARLSNPNAEPVQVQVTGTPGGEPVGVAATTSSQPAQDVQTNP